MSIIFIFCIHIEIWLLLELMLKKQIYTKGMKRFIIQQCKIAISFISEELPYITFPLHTVLVLRPAAYGCSVEQMTFNIDCVNTHRPKPEVSETHTCHLALN